MAAHYGTAGDATGDVRIGDVLVIYCCGSISQVILSESEYISSISLFIIYHQYLTGISSTSISVRTHEQ